MRIASPPLLMMATRTDKEARLKDFISVGLTHRPEGATGAESITIVVRNPDSPAARAVCAALSQSDLGVNVRVIFGETHADDPMAVSLLDISCGEFRVLGDPRFGAAHEQLVVGTHVWTGDCLRRDPNKRDAFEVYHSGDASIRLYAAASFEKLWAAARPIKPVRARAVAPEIIAAGQTDESDAMPRNHHH
jgi:hypothetical protein